MQTKKTIAIFTTSEGHQSIAEAVAQTLKNDFRVVTFFYKDPMMRTYMPFYQLFPHLFSIPFKISQYDKLTTTIRSGFKKRIHKKLLAFIEEHHPDIFINTYMMFVPSLEEISQSSGIPFINILPDPRTIHPLSVSEQATTNTVFDKTQLSALQENHEHAGFSELGWFVRDEFEQQYDQALIRKKLHLAKKKFTLLIASGSEGTALVLKLIGLLTAPKKNLQIVVACGGNTTLFRTIQLTKKILRQSGHATTIIPLRYVSNLHEYMQAADLIVGKAGPNTLFEAVATRTPFFAITHIAGQEDGNLDIIRDYKIGYVEENPMKATKMINRIIQHPIELEVFQSHITTMHQHNSSAKSKLLELVNIYCN